MKFTLAATGAALFATLTTGTSGAMAQETAKDVVADHVRIQGNACKNPKSATRDKAASKPDEAVWVLKCDGAVYRVRLVPDMAAKVEKISN